MTITRERHAFESQSLAAISSIRRRGVLFVLVVLPDGSRSLIPAEWTDWIPEQADRTPADEVAARAITIWAASGICFTCAGSSTL